MKSVGVISLGCSKNLVDAEIMTGLLLRAGWQYTDDLAQAEIIVVNTCTFIEPAKDESILAILTAAKYKETGRCRRLVVTGCLSEQYRTELFKEISEIDVLLGTASWDRIVAAVEAAETEERVAVYERQSRRVEPAGLPRERTTPDYMAYVKVAEGCSNGCTFCLIPYVRGGFRSRTPESMLQEVRSMAAEGVREINLIAQDTTSYGRDLDEPTTLTALLQQITAVEGIEWVRLLYLYPKYFTDELLAEVVRNPKVCKYIDIPLQHISDPVLQRMHRRDRAADIRALLRKIRAQETYITLRTTFIVGFPGETEDDFRALCDLVREIRFDRVGVFRYSREEGTPAARLPEQIPEEVKEERYHTLMAVQAQISEEINRECVGRRETALVETAAADSEDGVAVGRLRTQAPEVDGLVYIENGEELPVGAFVPVEITAGYAYDLVAQPCGEAF
ncbi:MAG: 30S ribosomal protein S12 methylthiotransferase RimO [Veillonellaceae bacterium]|nr:30S ribosomal protein S12 methylthiotransferase RimO [Veillonellaceae bacterium]